MALQPGSAPPPSERGDEPAPEERRGVGVFRFAGWGWGFTIALALLVGVVVAVGYLRDDPGRNPAPAAYREAVCMAADELAAGTEALGRGVEGRDDAGVRDAEAAEVETRVEAADDTLAGLPEWLPGRSLDELLGSQIITLLNGAGALAEDEDAVEEDLARAREADAEIRQQLASGRYGFSCP